ncbi:hypothetical protein N24_2322 [Corynebacterium suranareeae]|uniref:Uncharacterized protein n=1 Tax=Corynebacterium suranareeae TaxID=2506452 RepID=A0A160PSA2_9CORY|nr:hypothetical protein [Corynebacterium suranareeae]BAU96584.1 hypothetical protein N24_2322 [Corynebacterium suranareeae]
MSYTVPFGDAWAQVIEAATETVSITDTLDALRISSEQADWAAEFGPLLCGHAKLPLSPQLTEFHRYTRS